jgi:DNA-binding transcriptional LysR family regulator
MATSVGLPALHRKLHPRTVIVHECTLGRSWHAIVMSMTSDDLQVFLAALRTTSLAGAAVALGVDRTTVGRRIEALEASVGTPLFVRMRGGLRPTEAALRLREPAERIVGELRTLASTGLGLESAVKGVVRIATSEGLAGMVVKKGLIALCAKYPELRLEIATSNLAVDLRAGEVDLALRSVPTREAGVKIRKVSAMVVALHASADYIRARGIPTSLAGLAGHDLLIQTGELSRLPEVRLLNRVVGARVVLRSTSLPVLIEAAVAGAGIVPVVGPWGQVTGLVKVLPLDIPARPLWVAIAPGQRDRPAVRVVADELARLMGAHAAAG